MAFTRGCLAREAPPAASRRNPPEDTRASLPLSDRPQNASPVWATGPLLWALPLWNLPGLSAPHSDELGIIVCLW